MPAGWTRCTNHHLGVSLGYPAGWYTVSIHRLRSLGETDAHKRRFFSHFPCTSFDPRPFMLLEGTEGPETAIAVSRYGSVRRAIRYRFDPTYHRVLAREWVRVGAHRALRYETYTLATAPMYERSSTYGYVIDMGNRGAIVIDAWRYRSRHTTEAAYQRYKHIADQMAPTARIVPHH